MQWMSIALGGALGAVGRFWVSNLVYAWWGRGLPWGTLAVNVLGSFTMGLLGILLVERLALSAQWRGVILVGFLGAFTTFSTFSLETFYLIEQGEPVKAALNVLMSVVACLFAVWGGVMIGRAL